MPEEITTQIQRIATQLKKVADKYAGSQKVVEKLQEDNRQLKEKSELLAGEIRHLQEQVFLLKASADPLNHEDRKAFEKMINEYLRTIDNCIANLKR